MIAQPTRIAGKSNDTQMMSQLNNERKENMKRVIVTVMLAAMAIVLNTTPASAEDVILQAKASKIMVDRLDKNGNPFTIIFIQEERTLSGVVYTAEAPVFAMGSAKDEAAKVSAGENFKAIVSKRQANGGDITYTLRKIVQ